MPRHGGVDPGTVINNIEESSINLEISKYLEYYLSINGANIIMTRDSSNDLSSPNIKRRKKNDFDNRLKIINNSNADLYISIHQNYLSDSRYFGPQVFYNKDNKTLASDIQSYLNSKNLGNRTIKEIPKNTYMYNKIKIHGVLIECGFLSNYDERNRLTENEYQKKIAQYITEAIIKYYY